MSNSFRCHRHDCKYKAKPPEGTPTQFALNGCNYMAITGKSRIAQLPPHLRDPALCPLYEPGILVQMKPYAPVPRPKRVRVPREWEIKAMELYKAGKNDTEIAQACGVKPYNIANWRARQKLPAVPGAQKNLNRVYTRRRTFDTAKAMEMYKAGKLDFEIAEALTVSRQTIARWRQDLVLKANDPRRHQKEVNTKYDWDLAMQLYEKNYSDAAIGAVLGCRSQTVQKWRKKKNLPTKYFMTKERG